jgi:hypothetical protein
MKRLAACLLLGLLAACVAQRDPVLDADAALASGMMPERLASGAVCRVGPDGGALIADRGIGGTGAPPVARQIADRGIGGTGIVGFITGFASICVDGLEVRYDGSALVDIDGTAAPASALRVGQVVVIQANGPAGAPVARTITVRREVAGQIESIDLASGTLTVAGQPVSVPTSIWGAKRARLGAWIAVSGMRRADGTIVASRLDNAPAGSFMARGQIQREGGLVKLGNLTLRGSAATSLATGQFITASGHYAAGQGQVDSVTSDTLSQDPRAFFGASVKHLVVQGLVRIANGAVALNGLKATAGSSLNARSGSSGIAIVSLERKPDGTYTAVGLRYTDYRGPAARAGRAVGAPVGSSTPAHDVRTPEAPQTDGAGGGLPDMAPPAVPDDADPGTPIARLAPTSGDATAEASAASATTTLAVTSGSATSGSASAESPASTLKITLAPVMALVAIPLAASVQGPAVSLVPGVLQPPMSPMVAPTVSTPPIQPNAPATGIPNDSQVSTSQMISGAVRPMGPMLAASGKPLVRTGTASPARSALASASAVSSTITLATGAIVPATPVGTRATNVRRPLSSASSAAAGTMATSVSKTSGAGGRLHEP